MSKQISKYILFLVPTISFIIVIYTTRFGIGISPDSMRYISAAESFRDIGELRSIHKGLPLEYMTHFPPVISILLWFINVFSNNIYEAFRILNAISIFTFLLFISVAYKSKLNIFKLIILQLLVMVNLEFFALYEMAWSEPLFISLSFVGLYYLNLFINNLKFKYLIISAVIISVASITRYVGLFLITSSVIYLWLSLRNKNILFAIKQIVFFGFVSSFGFVYWMVRNMILSDSATNRELSIHFMTMDYYKEWLLSTANYFTGLSSSEIGINISYVFGAIIILALIVFSIKKLSNISKGIDYLLVLFSAVYFVLLFVSNTFYDFTPLYYRTLSPIYVLFSISFYAILLQGKFKFTKLGLVVISLLMLVYGAKFAVHTLRVNDGKELSSKAYVIPSSIDALNSLEKETKIYTNEGDRIYYLADGRLSDLLIDVRVAEEDSFYIVYFYNGRPDYFGIIDSIKPYCEQVISTDDLIIMKHNK